MYNLCKKDEVFEWTEKCNKSFGKFKELLSNPPILIFPDFSQPFILMSYQFQIIYKSGKSNVVADALSRIQITSDDSDENEGRKIDYDMLKIKRKAIGVQTRAQREKEKEKRAELTPIIEIDEPTALDNNLSPENESKQNQQPNQNDQSDDNRNEEHQHDVSDQIKRKYYIHEKKSVVLNSKEYDYIFYVIQRPNDILHRKLQHKLKKLIDLQDVNVNELHSLDTNKSIIINPSKFRNSEELELGRTLAELLFNFCSEKGIENIAINIQFSDPISHFEFRIILYKIFKYTTISLTLFLNELMEVTELDDIDKILYMYHNSLFGAHNGIERMKNNIKNFYHWPNMNDDIKKHVDDCAICEKTKITTHIKSPMVITTIATEPFQKIYVDIYGPINPISEKGNSFILTCNCSLTKFVIAVPIPEQSAITTAKALVHSVFLKYGLPEILVTDNGKNFISETLREVNKLFKIKKIFTTPYRPQSNQIERFHRTLGSYMKAFVQKEQDQWCEYIDFAVFAYNSSHNISTGYSPFELVYGRPVKLPTEITRRTIPTYNYENYAHELRRKLKFYYDLAKENLIKAKEVNKKGYDKNRDKDILHFKKNDLVLITNLNKQGKFEAPYEGPYKVIRENGPVTVIIQKRNKEIKIHKDRIKLAKADYSHNTPPLIE